MRRRHQPPHLQPDEDREKLHILEGLDTALSRWPEVSGLAFEAESSRSLIENLMALLDVDAVQATAISDMQIRRLGRSAREQLAGELTELREHLRLAEAKPATESPRRPPT